MTDTAAPAPAPNLDHEAPQSQSGGASAPLAEQLDIPMLDEYLQTLLLPQVDGMLQYLPWKARIPATIKLALLQFATLWISQGQTPATRALKLQLKLGSSPSSAPGVGPHTRPNKRQPMVSLVHQKIIVYAILSIGLPRLYQYTKDFVRMQQQQQQRPESTTLIPEDDIIDYETSMIQRLARERRRSTLETMFRVVDTAIPMIRLSLLLSCWSLYSRKKMTPMVPNLVMWLVGWQYTTNTTNTSSSQIIHGGIDTSSRQLLHVQHAHRRWLQEEGMRLVPMLITPLWNTCQESRDYLRACSRSVLQPLRRQMMVRFEKLYLPSSSSNSSSITPNNTSCPICSTDPIGIPYETNCGHVYCYSCLWHEHVQQEQSSCRVCHELISSCRPCD